VGEFFNSTTAAIVSAILTYAAVCVVLAERSAGSSCPSACGVGQRKRDAALARPDGRGLRLARFAALGRPRPRVAAIGAFFALG